MGVVIASRITTSPRIASSPTCLRLGERWLFIPHAFAHRHSPHVAIDCANVPQMVDGTSTRYIAEVSRGYVAQSAHPLSDVLRSPAAGTAQGQADYAQIRGSADHRARAGCRGSILVPKRRPPR